MLWKSLKRFHLFSRFEGHSCFEGHYTASKTPHIPSISCAPLRMTTATTLLLVKDFVSLLCATLRRYGYQVSPLLDVLDTTREKYHEMLLHDCSKKIQARDEHV